MESNGMSSVMFSGFSPGMLSLEMPQNPQNPHNPLQFQHPQVVSYAGNNGSGGGGGGGGGGDHHQQQHHHTQPPMKSSPYPYASKHKQLSPLSDEDEPGSGSGSGYNPDDSTGPDAKRMKFSPWQRMKWTDMMVRLLIMAVFYIGDEAGLSEPSEPAKKKPSSGGGGGGGLLQKKGKWKSVSRAMMEKGFYVSPQQCEDKFNDLNKRYKRVNDILGKGTACRVVENQSLLESMDLQPKLKEEVKKLLNSKHLFFREMCAYHNSCGHLTANTNTSASDHPQTQTQTQTQTPPHPQQSCFHSAAAVGGESVKMTRIAESEEESETGDESESEEECESGAVRGLMEEAGRVAMDGAKGGREKKEWIKRKMMELEEKRVGYEWEAVEMEKQKLKWMKFKCKKEKEMEKARLENQRRKLENERMMIVLRRKEMELDHPSGKRVDSGSAAGS